MDWTGCDLVEIRREARPGTVNALPLVRGTSILADAVLDYADQGINLDEILEDFPALTVPTVQALIAFAHARRGVRWQGDGDA
jgi:uncharacterized protein (DUF433 family)